MTDADLKAALKIIRAERDPSLKHLLLAALCTKVFAKEKIQLVVVGGSAIEFYTEGAYTSGDIDLCTKSDSPKLGLRQRQELMGRLDAKGGPRSWEISGAFVDLLGPFEGLGKSQFRRLSTQLGEVAIAPPEELLVERVLVGNYPSNYPPALECARKLAASALRKEIDFDWSEARRLANLKEYRNEEDLRKIVAAEAKALALRSPYHSQ